MRSPDFFDAMAESILLTSVPMTELQLVDLLLTNASHLGADIAGREVRSHGRARTDVVLLVGGEVVGIEVKKNDWRRAIAQAVLNRYCVDRSYIALWSDRIADPVVTEASAWGIGVISITREGVEIISRAPRAQPERELRETVLEQLRSG